MSIKTTGNSGSKLHYFTVCKSDNVIRLKTFMMNESYKILLAHQPCHLSSSSGQCPSMETELVFETLVFNSALMWLVIRVDFMEVIMLVVWYSAAV